MIGILGKLWRHAVARSRIMLRDLFVNEIAASTLIPRTIRRQIYRVYGMQIGTKNVSPRCFFGGPSVRIGPGTFVNYGCFFETSVDVGRNCAIGMKVLFCNSTHAFGGADRRAGLVVTAPITVGDGCWIGARAVVLPGVTLGAGCIIAAGAVVVSDCQPNGLYAGIPARRVRDLE